MVAAYLASSNVVRVDPFGAAAVALMSSHVEITQETHEDGTKSRVISWPARQFIVSQDTPGGSWSVFDVEANEIVAEAETSTDALKIATGNPIG